MGATQYMFTIKKRVRSVPLFTLQTEGQIMKLNQRRQFAQVVLFSLISLGAGSAFAQVAAGEGRGDPKGGCPYPIGETINVGPPNQSDFKAESLAAQVGLNNAVPNKQFLGTFQWKPKSKCCEITRAVLTVKMKANSGGQSATTADAGNDTIGVTVAGGVGAMPQPGGVVYGPTFPFPAGTLVTKTFNITGTALAKLESGGGLSFLVQDDTMVTSASLQLSGCCLSR